MRLLIVLLAVAGLAGGFLAVGWAQASAAASTETVQLTAEKRVLLQRLRAETKFRPHDYPPLGYTGAETPEEAARATAAVNEVVDAVLQSHDGAVHAKAVSQLIGRAMGKVDLLATEDRDRTAGYLLEVWYILGFKGATGRFAYGSGFPRPPGHAEPLPPGWEAPDRPRPID